MQEHHGNVRNLAVRSRTGPVCGTQQASRLSNIARPARSVRFPMHRGEFRPLRRTEYGDPLPKDSAGPLRRKKRRRPQPGVQRRQAASAGSDRRLRGFPGQLFGTQRSDHRYRRTFSQPNVQLDVQLFGQTRFARPHGGDAAGHNRRIENTPAGCQSRGIRKSPAGTVARALFFPGIPIHVPRKPGDGLLAADHRHPDRSHRDDQFHQLLGGTGSAAHPQYQYAESTGPPDPGTAVRYRARSCRDRSDQFPAGYPAHPMVRRFAASRHYPNRSFPGAKSAPAGTYRNDGTHRRSDRRTLPGLVQHFVSARFGTQGGVRPVPQRAPHPDRTDCISVLHFDRTDHRGNFHPGPKQVPEKLRRGVFPGQHPSRSDLRRHCGTIPLLRRPAEKQSCHPRRNVHRPPTCRERRFFLGIFVPRAPDPVQCRHSIA